jgi:hypothetical protein
MEARRRRRWSKEGRLMAELSKAVQDAARQLGEQLREGPRTLNELRDWWVKDKKGEPGAFQDAAKYLIKMGLIEARNLGKTKMLALAGQHHQRPSKGSPIVQRDAKPENAAAEAPRTWTPGSREETAEERNARLERAASRPLTAVRVENAKLGHVFDAGATARVVERGSAAIPPRPPVQASPAAVAPPPSPSRPAPPRPSTSAPSPAPSSAATLNVGSPERSPETRGFSRSYNQERFTPPPPDADGTEWINMFDAAAMLGLKSAASMEYVRKTYAWVRRKQKVAKAKQPFFYARPDIAKLVEHRRGNALVHAQRPPRHVEQPGDLPSSGVRVPRYFEPPVGVKADAPPEPLDAGDDQVDAYRPALAEHQRLVSAASLPTISIKDLAPGRYVHLDLGVEPRALLERLLATGLYGGGSVHELAERLLLAELRRHVDMPRLIERARR